MASTNTVKLSVDRIDGDTAVLVDASRQIAIPASWLPEGAVEGTSLDLELSVNLEDTDDLARRIVELQAARGGGSREDP